MLQLKEYFFPIVNVTSDPKYVSEGAIEIPWEIKVSIVENKEESLYQVTVEMLLAGENEEERAPYTVQLVVIGFFAVHPDWEDPEKLLFVNGSSLLYSAAREFLITVTARMPWGQVMLPTHNFLADHKKQHPSTKAEDGAEEVKKERS